MKNEAFSEWLRNIGAAGRRQDLETTPILPSSVYTAYVVRPSHLQSPARHSTTRALNALTQRQRFTPGELDSAAVKDHKTERERIAIQLMARASGRLVPGDLSAVAPDPRGPAMTPFARMLRDQRKTTVAELDAQCEDAHLTITQQIACKLQASWAGRLV